jgi:hypothetical protein
MNDTLVTNLVRTLQIVSADNANAKKQLMDTTLLERKRSRATMYSVLNDTYGTPDWSQNQYVTSDVGVKMMFIPYLKDKKVSAYLIAVNSGRNYRFIVMQIQSDNAAQTNAKQFNGNVSFRDFAGGLIGNFPIVDGKYSAPANNMAVNSTHGALATAARSPSCTVACMYSCLNDLANKNPLLFTGCAAACSAFSSVIGAVACGVCVGVAAGVCMDQCQCNSWISALWGQCGGVAWEGGLVCPSGTTCNYVNNYYSQCVPVYN